MDHKAPEAPASGLVCFPVRPPRQGSEIQYLSAIFQPDDTHCVIKKAAVKKYGFKERPLQRAEVLFENEQQGQASGMAAPTSYVEIFPAVGEKDLKLSVRVQPDHHGGGTQLLEADMILGYPAAEKMRRSGIFSEILGGGGEGGGPAAGTQTPRQGSGSSGRDAVYGDPRSEDDENYMTPEFAEAVRAAKAMDPMMQRGGTMPSELEGSYSDACFSNMGRWMADKTDATTATTASRMKNGTWGLGSEDEGYVERQKSSGGGGEAEEMKKGA